MREPYLVEENPDRSNIVLKKCFKLPGTDISRCYEAIYQPEVERLHSELDSYPVTLIYLPLNMCAEASDYCYDIFEDDGPITIENTRFGVLFSNQDTTVSRVIIENLKMPNPRIRLVFCSSSVRMGFDSPSITRVIHGCPPRNMSDYFQQVGRAGRTGQPSEAILYYNNNDIAPNLPNITSDIIEYCKNETSCLRLLILSKFGFDKPEEYLSPCKCCYICAETCDCDLCT